MGNARRLPLALLALASAASAASPGYRGFAAAWRRKLKGNDITDKQADAANSLEGQHLNIIVVEDPPFVVVRDLADPSKLLPCGDENAPSSTSCEWKGWLITLLQEVQAVAGFTYDLQVRRASLPA